MKLIFRNHWFLIFFTVFTLTEAENWPLRAHKLQGLLSLQLIIHCTFQCNETLDSCSKLTNDNMQYHISSTDIQSWKVKDKSLLQKYFKSCFNIWVYFVLILKWNGSFITDMCTVSACRIFFFCCLFCFFPFFGKSQKFEIWLGWLFIRKDVVKIFLPSSIHL